MRVYISVDMEGIAGINHPHPTDPADRRYPVAVDLMVGETNAAIEGALAAGATDILVNDSHWNMYNLLAGRPASGRPRAPGPEGVVDGRGRPGRRRTARPSFDVALFVGYHARAGHPTGTIAHTYSGMPVETRLDGRPTGEYGMNALALGAWGIPVGLVAGDDALAEEVEDWLPWAERVVVKTVDGGRQRDLGPPDGRPRAGPRRRRARGPARRGRRAASSLRGRPAGRRSRSTSPRGVIADHAAIMPGAERVGDRTVRFAHDDPETAFRGFLADRSGLVESRQWLTEARPRSTSSRDRAPRRSPARGARGPARRRRSGRSAHCCACSASPVWTGPGGRSPAPQSTAGWPAPQTGSAAGSRCRSRWPCSSTTSSRSSSRSMSRPGPSTWRSRRSSCASRDRRGVAEAEARRLADVAIERIDADRVGAARARSTCSARRRRPWLGHDARRARSRRGARRGGGPRVAPASTCSASRCRSAASWPTACRSAGVDVPEWRPGDRRGGGPPAPSTSTTSDPAPVRQPARPGPAPSRRRRRRRPAPRLRAARHGDPAARGARGRRRRRVRTGRPRRGRSGGRDRGRRRRPRPVAGRPRVRAPAASASRHVRVDRAGAAGRGARPRIRRAVRSGDAIGSSARAPAAGRRAGAGRRALDGPDRRRGLSRAGWPRSHRPSLASLPRSIVRRALFPDHTHPVR